MRRMRLLVTMVLLVVVAETFLLLRPEDPRAARAQLIDPEHCDRITKGMSRAEVEDILGGSPGTFTKEKL